MTAVMLKPRTSGAAPDLHKAVRAGNTTEVVRCLGAGADMEEPDPRTGKTPLIYAGQLGRLEIAKILVQAGARIDAAVPKDIPEGVVYRLPILKGRTALWYAAKSHPRVARALIKAGANVNAKDSAGTSVLVRAVGQPDLRRMLLESGATE